MIKRGWQSTIHSCFWEVGVGWCVEATIVAKMNTTKRSLFVHFQNKWSISTHYCVLGSNGHLYDATEIVLISQYLSDNTIVIKIFNCVCKLSCTRPILVCPKKGQKDRHRDLFWTCPGHAVFLEISRSDTGQHFRDTGHDM